MTEEQREQMLAFIANLVKYLIDEGMPHEHVKMAAEMAASCLLATVFHIGSPESEPQADEITHYVQSVIHTALGRFGGKRRMLTL